MRFFYRTYRLQLKSSSDVLVFCVDALSKLLNVGWVLGKLMWKQSLANTPVGAAALRHEGDVVVEELAEQFTPFLWTPTLHQYPALLSP